jgi:hypothetical protein
LRRSRWLPARQVRFGSVADATKGLQPAKSGRTEVTKYGYQSYIQLEKLMNYKRALKESLRFWPEDIDISDGKVFSEGGTFPQLSRHWRLAEEHAGKWSEWHQLAVWAIFCAIHLKARNELTNGNFRLAKSNIDLSYVQQKFAENLLRQDSSYPRFMRRSFMRQIKA